MAKREKEDAECKEAQISDPQQQDFSHIIPQDREGRIELLGELLRARQLTEAEALQRQKEYEWERAKHEGKFFNNNK